MNIYSRVTYTVLLVDSVLDLKIGDKISDRSLYNSCFITAFNPNGKKVNIHKNWDLNNDLMDYILDNGFSYYHGYGHLDKWVENSFLIKDITLAQSKILGKKYKQIAFVYINGDGVVELYYS